MLRFVHGALILGLTVSAVAAQSIEQPDCHVVVYPSQDPPTGWIKSPGAKQPYFTLRATCPLGEYAISGGFRHEGITKNPSSALEWLVVMSEPLEEEMTKRTIGWHCGVLSMTVSESGPPPHWCSVNCCRTTSK